MLDRVAILMVYFLILISCRKQETRFQRVDPSISNITFNNHITVYDSFNILNTEFIYNGSGVAIGDLNGDGLEDLYFAGNQVDNACYLNLGDFKFKDITTIAGVQKKSGQWSSGVNIIDINADGRKDIYVCNTLIKDPNSRRKLLFINQGNQDGIPIFKEEAELFGLADTTHASHAQFFDFDRDGDLDLFIGTNFIERSVPGQFVKNLNEDCNLNCDKLYRQDRDSVSHHAYFTDISMAAGLSLNGYTHSSLIYDFNEDGWQDIYIANDYLSDDLIYINNKNGTFTNQVAQIFRHQSSSAMGSDLGDINNDGQVDVMTVEMLPFTNLRKKTLIGPSTYSSYIYIKQYGYQYQYTRNTLQLNQGLNPVTKFPVYNEISFLSEVHETEWSWAPLFADFDLDGFQDLYITNGFPKDVTDRDFGEYRNETSNLISQLDLQYMIPEVKVSNFMFQNNKDLKFNDVSGQWGLSIKSFSNGAAYGDLDNDGDLDLVVNNIDDMPFVFQNNTIGKNSTPPELSYVSIILQGSGLNTEAIGAKVQLFQANSVQSRSVLSSRGYLSNSSNKLVFGFGSNAILDSIKVFWPDGTIQIFDTLISNHTVILQQSTGLPTSVEIKPSHQPLFRPLSATGLKMHYKHDERDFIDFNIQKTLPHKLSQYGVPMAVGDVNGDSLEDLILGGSAHQDEVLFLQKKDNSYVQSSLPLKSLREREREDAALVLFDADLDDDLDLVIAGGSYESLMADPQAYQVRLYLNDGAGNFIRDTLAILSDIRTCASTVRVADIDSDGDQDIFVGGHVLPGYYPKADKSFILLNQSKPGQVRFVDGTAHIAPQLNQVGIINDALFTDYNNDNKPDLLLAIEWGSLTIFQNDGKELKKLIDPVLDHNTGWWTSLTSGDFDNDGDMDYIAGNYGQNVYFKCNSKEPISIYAKDFDQNGSLDPFISCYWRDTLGTKKEYFFHGRDDMIKQLISLRRKFKNYTSFGLATVNDVFSPDELKDALVLKATNLQSVMLRNDGQGHFKMNVLPQLAQLAPLYGMISADINQDEYLDLMITGNDYGLELVQGRADAMQGLVLINDGRGGFLTSSIQESGYFVHGDAKSMVRSKNGVGNDLYFSMLNLDSLVIHTMNRHYDSYQVNSQEYSGSVEFKNGTKRRLEFYRGNSFKGQSSQWQSIAPNAAKTILQNVRTNSIRSINN